MKKIVINIAILVAATTFLASSDVFAMETISEENNKKISENNKTIDLDKILESIVSNGDKNDSIKTVKKFLTTTDETVLGRVDEYGNNFLHRLFMNLEQAKKKNLTALFEAISPVFDSNISLQANKNEQTPFGLINTKILVFLVKIAIHEKNYLSASTLIKNAIRSKNYGAAQKILKFFPQLADSKTKDNKTLLHIAYDTMSKVTNDPNKEIMMQYIDFIIQFAKSSCEKCQNISDYIKNKKTLLEKFTNIATKENIKKMDALVAKTSIYTRYCIKSGNFKLAESLLEENRLALYAQNYDGKTLLHSTIKYLVKKHRAEEPEQIKDAISFVKYLCRKKITIGEKDIHGKTAADYFGDLAPEYSNLVKKLGGQSKNIVKNVLT